MERLKSHLLMTHALEISESFDCGEAFGYGNFQRGVLLFAIVSVWVMHAHTLSFPLISGELDHWCKKPRDVNVSDDAWKSSAIPLEDDGRRSQCTVYASPDDHNDSAVVHCEQWDYDAEVAHTTIVSSWNLVCHRRWLLPLAIAVFMAGSLGFLVVGGAVADIIGRKLTILGATCVLMLAAFGGCFADTYLIYVSTRFFISGASCTLCIISGVLVAEVSTNRHRAVHVSFSGIAGLWLGDAWFAVLREVRLNWIALQFLMVAPTLLLPLGCAFIRESPRWLIARHKLKGAEAVVHEVARANGFPEDGASAFIERLRSQELEHAKASMATATGEFKSLITGTVLRRGMVVFFRVLQRHGRILRGAPDVRGPEEALDAMDVPRHRRCVQRGVPGCGGQDEQSDHRRYGLHSGRRQLLPLGLRTDQQCAGRVGHRPADLSQRRDGRGRGHNNAVRC
ncbi:solute carrier family 22 member 4-like [Amblyomma americanum]